MSLFKFTVYADVVLLPVCDDDDVEFLRGREVYWSILKLGPESNSTHYFIYWDDDPDREPVKYPVYPFDRFTDRIFLGFHL